MRKTVYLFFVLMSLCLVLQAQSGDVANMVLVEGGTFRMGSDYLYEDEMPIHDVTLSSFWIAKYEVTQKEWQAMMGSNPSGFRGDNLPVENVSWYDAVEYCNKRSVKEGLTPCYSGSGDNISCNWNANGYRLPTEAEWEYAALGGNKSRGYEYSGSNTLDDVGWYFHNSGEKTHPVGQKSPNELGIYDMSGNVGEWCWDWFDESYYSKSPKNDPRGGTNSGYRVLRGGSWPDRVFCWVAFRRSKAPDGRNDYLGFRVVRSMKGSASTSTIQEKGSTTSSPALVHVEGGTFKMGSNDYHDEKPIHEVAVSSFWISQYQVTQRQWREVMGSNPSTFKGDNLPVESVSWHDAVEYCNKLSIKEGLTPCYSGSGNNISCNWNANGYRLPTEAEWEYAARGGNKSRAYKYAGSNTLSDVAWYVDNSGEKTHPVGQKSPNELGIYDMSGNVWEWCWDWYDSSYYNKSLKKDPRGAASGDQRVLRGGSWYNIRVSGCGVSYRFKFSSTDRFSSVGFRVSRSMKGSVSTSTIQDKGNTMSSPALVHVEGGTFMMGSNDGYGDEQPVHEVTLSSFWISKYQVTQKEWLQVMDSNPSCFIGDNLPVDIVQWNDALTYCNKLSIKEGLTPCYSDDDSCNWDADGYRLPTEAEWEYAARGGNKSRGYQYAGSNTLGDVAWYGDNSDGETHPVGQKSPNELGIYDMSGNVWEWCWDWYDESYYSRSPKKDPRCEMGSEFKLWRGGSWIRNVFDSRVAYRESPNVAVMPGTFGLRVVRNAK